MTHFTDEDRELFKLMGREIAFGVFEEAMPHQCERCKATKDIAKFKWLLIGIGIGMPVGTAGIVVGVLKLLPKLAAAL